VCINKNGGVIIELSDEELELVCDSLTTEWLDINDNFILWENPNEANLRMHKCFTLKDRLRETKDAHQQEQ
jgi:hypothetical protein